MLSFKFMIKEYFNLSTGATALVGIIDTSDYPIIKSNDFIVELKSNNGAVYRFESINEDLFSRNKDQVINYRSLQTFEDIDNFLKNIKNDPITIYGYKKQ